MEMNEYQKKAMETCMPSCMNHSYMIGLILEEAGELRGKVNKAIRKGLIKIENNMIVYTNPNDVEAIEDFEIMIEKELGDILWAAAGTASVFKWNLADVGRNNIAKLADRKNRNVIVGEGDNR